MKVLSLITLSFLMATSVYAGFESNDSYLWQSGEACYLFAGNNIFQPKVTVFDYYVKNLRKNECEKNGAHSMYEVVQLDSTITTSPAKVYKMDANFLVMEKCISGEQHGDKKTIIVNNVIINFIHTYDYLNSNNNWPEKSHFFKVIKTLKSL